MSKVPQLKPKEAASIVKKLGFIFMRQTGSHAHFKHPDGRRVTIAMHNKPIPPGTLNSIIKKELEMDLDDFLKLL